MTTRLSSGILLYRYVRDGAEAGPQGDAGGGLEILLAHPGGPYYAKRDEGCWTIPKGQPDGEDDLWRVAEREFGEETGHSIEDVRRGAGAAMELGTIVLASGKIVHGWAVEGDLDPGSLVSNEFEIEWPPRSGTRGRFPEIDRVAWLGPDEARRRIHPAQAAFIERLEAALGSAP